MFLFFNWEKEFPLLYILFCQRLRNAAPEKCLTTGIGGAAINKSNNEEIMHAQVGFSRCLIKSY